LIAIDRLLGNLSGLPEMMTQCCEAKIDQPTTLDLRIGDHALIDSR
jgi:hypothetical protein